MKNQTLQEIKDDLNKTSSEYRVAIMQAHDGREKGTGITLKYLLQDKELIKKYGKKNLESVGKDIKNLAKYCKEHDEYIEEYSKHADAFCGIISKRKSYGRKHMNTPIEDLLDAIDNALDRKDN